MKTIQKYMVGVLILALLTGTALGFDASTPYTVQLNLIVPSDTTFTVTLASPSTTIDFSPATLNSKCVEPTNQVNATNIAMVNITNSGNVGTGYSINLTTGAPSWVVIKAATSSAAANCNTGGTAFNTTGLYLSGWNNTQPNGIASVYLFANFTSATGGTTARTFQVNANQS